jgi:hypothetical protein
MGAMRSMMPETVRGNWFAWAKDGIMPGIRQVDWFYAWFAAFVSLSNDTPGIWLYSRA